LKAGSRREVKRSKGKESKGRSEYWSTVSVRWWTGWDSRARWRKFSTVEKYSQLDFLKSPLLIHPGRQATDLLPSKTIYRDAYAGRIKGTGKPWIIGRGEDVFSLQVVLSVYAAPVLRR
jgi:hypothetical protein